MSRRLVRHEELTTMRSPLLPWHFLSLGFRIVFLSNLFRSLFSPVTGTERLVRQKSNTHKRPAYSIVYKGNVFFFFSQVEWGQHTPATKYVKPGKKMCVPQQRSDNRRETDRHTIHNKPFDAILNNVRSIETFRRVSVKCGAFILDEENNGILTTPLTIPFITADMYLYSLTYT